MLRRGESTPKQQLAELRRAYDYYAARAALLKNTTDGAIDAQLQRSLAEDAARIAAAYKKSVANICEKMESASQSKRKAAPFTVLAAGSVLGVAVIAAAIFAIFYRPALVELILPDGVLTAVNGQAVVSVDTAPDRPNALILRSSRPLKKDERKGPEKTVDRRCPVATSQSLFTNDMKIPFSDARPESRLDESSVLKRRSRHVPATFASNHSAAKTRRSPPPLTTSESQAAVMGTQAAPKPSPVITSSPEAGVTQVQVATAGPGQTAECHVVGTSGSPRLDSLACPLVLRYRDGAPTEPTNQREPTRTIVAVIWSSNTPK